MDALAQLAEQAKPLTDAIERAGNFEPYDQMKPAEQAQVAAVYILPQLTQGGFIQIFHNGYTFLLLPLVEWLQQNHQEESVQLIDDALKYYVEHKEDIDAPEDAQSFAQLYVKHPLLEQLEHELQPHLQDILQTLIKA